MVYFNKESNPEKAKFLLQKWQNTAIWEKNRQHIPAYGNHFWSITEPEDVEMKEIFGNEDLEDSSDFNNETELSLKENDNKPLDESVYLSLPPTRQDLTQSQWPKGRL